jgi:hypothetical protein
MKNTLNTFVLVLFAVLAFPNLSSGQSNLNDELKFEVNRIYPPISISKTDLNEAATLVDLDKNYKSSWIRKYISVEVQTTSKGKVIKSIVENAILKKQQKKLINFADDGSEINVKLKNINEKNFNKNNIKEI